MRIAAMIALIWVALGASLLGCTAEENRSASAPSSAKTVAPAPGSEEGQAIAAVLAAIEAGEPSPYPEDGETFQNREGLLPDQPVGYYSEYTVETPSSADRGARRLVIGSGGETYYTSDHYVSFERIDPEDFR